MKLLVYSSVTLIVIVVMMLIALSVASRKQPDLGLVDGQLPPCPATPNCVCSEYPVEGASIEPLGYYTLTPDEAWARLKRVVAETGGEVMAEQAGYLHAVYTTPLLRFVDDVEFRLDKKQQVIHIRSASRVGRSDFGANRTRVEKIRAAFGEQAG
ncbi:DUF1499 domain-containing protein [Thiohalophilus thiocyanatoxydans]|uniref:Uncharacterized protein (DUF1499 family) n=1 Tax=Thiohalophilus thiocyanatoxydans TaxID=381308 RepID=A0A4R8J1E6_9GAMM|nr:DUF1499 domain-containing protein [Thiohalophilus thiocyanatoxydans]TDY03999.1 uncharacterized protein (DUF1499 family) [Thiohalophilus thiocyanatoxydans]